MSSTFYQASGRVPVTLVPAFLLGLAATLPLAWAYAWLIVYVPLVLNALIAFAYSFCLGLLVTAVAAGAKVRNPGWMSRTGVLLALAGWYGQWAAWVALTAAGQFAGAPLPELFLAFAADPLAMLRFVLELGGSGALHVGNWRVPGFILALVWLGELAMHLMLPPLLGRMRAEQPFCEASNSWAEKVAVARRFALVGDEEVDALAAEPARLHALLVPLARPDAPDYAQLALYRCKGSSPFLTIVNVRTDPGDGGRSEQKKSPVLEYLALPGCDPEALLARWSQPAAEAHSGELPTPPELLPALALLQAEAHAEALAAASKHVDAAQAARRTDALRICGIACSRLDRWDEASRYWRALFDHETSAHNALQVATSAVMAGALASGIEWVEKAAALNAKSAELPGLQVWTNFVTALGRAGQERAAMPYLEKIRQVYAELGTTDATVLYARRIPFFSAFLDNSRPLVRAALDRESGRQWYAALLPELDEGGRQELGAWLENEFGEGVCP